MTAITPEQICKIFQRAMADGDLEAVLGVYDTEVVFLNELREEIRGIDGLRRELAPLVANRPAFDYEIKQTLH